MPSRVSSPRTPLPIPTPSLPNRKETEMESERTEPVGPITRAIQELTEEIRGLRADVA